MGCFLPQDPQRVLLDWTSIRCIARTWSWSRTLQRTSSWWGRGKTTTKNGTKREALQKWWKIRMEMRKSQGIFVDVFFSMECHEWSRWWFQIFFMFIPLFGGMIQFDKHIFQGGWNHQLDDWCETCEAPTLLQSRVVDGRQISRCVYVFSFRLWHRKASAWNNFEAKDVRKTIGKPFLANSLCLIPTPTFPNQHHGCKREFVCLGSRRITTQKHRHRPSFQSNKFSCINLSLMPRCSQARKSSSIEVFYPKSPNVYFKQPFAPRA